VAGFVGVSNLILGPAALAIVGSDQVFAVRPEKIHLGHPGDTVPEGMLCADGVISEVIYLGMYTRYLVHLDQDTDLTVVQQNLKTTSMDVLAARGQRVRLSWERPHMRTLSM
jgi:putative spermidine/putrescine transport system ATP-binding protein